MNQLTNSERQFITFWIGKNFFGIDIMQVKEVSSEFSITPLFHGPEPVRGYVNLRGEIFLILDLRVPLHLMDASAENPRLIIFKEIIAEPFGIIVDKIGDVVRVSQEDVQEFTDKTDSSTLNLLHERQIINGICRLEHSLMISLDAKKILELLKSS